MLVVALCATAAAAQAPPLSPPVQAPPAQQNQATQNAALPEAPYVALSTNQKFHIFVKQTYSPYTFVSAGFGALWSQATGDPYEYGGGLPGYGRRLGASLANTEANRFFKRFLFASMLGQDPRYFPAKRNLPIPRRGVYAATRFLITRGDNGKNQFNYSEMFGDLCTVALENAYYPERQRGVGDTMNRFSGALLSTVTSDLTREFWPDVARIFRRHEPKRVQKIEQEIEKKIPPSMLPSPQ